MRGKNLLILHNFGGVGKSTIGGCLIHPRVGGELMSIETNNTDAERYGVRVRRYAAAQYSDYYRDLRRFSVYGNTVTDVGASNAEAFIDKVNESGGRDQFDYIVVPATQNDRGQIETITTIQTLLDNVGVDPDRIRVVLNMVRKPVRTAPIEGEFTHLFAFAEQDRRVKINPKCYIPQLQLFSHLAAANRSWLDVVNDRTDYSAKIMEAINAGDTTAEELACDNALLQEMAGQARDILDRAWAELNIDIHEPARKVAAPATSVPTEQHEQ
ncbi:hypothetical protein [Paraburkholderia sp. GAS32]|uniref:hypothetical protein n=1 Tax=Paraburkholderia sp. GAS32 TaxID=3035129 RepID=UPI003D21FFC9